MIPAYCHMRNTLLDCTRVGSKVTTCKKFAKTLLNSLETRLAYVLTDTFYILGIISPLSLLFLLSNFDFIILLFRKGAIFDPRFKLGWVSSAAFTESAVRKTFVTEAKKLYDSISKLNQSISDNNWTLIFMFYCF